MMGAVFQLIVGTVLLLFGRRMFWLFVGCIGFVTWIHFAGMYLFNQPTWMVLVVGLVSGIIGAVIAIFLQHVAIGLSGFAAGGIVTVRLLDMVGINAGPFLLISFIVGGIVGLVVMIWFFDWALISLSSLVGSAFLTEFFHFSPPLNFFIFVGLFVIGILVQAKLFPRSGRSDPGGFR